MDTTSKTASQYRNALSELKKVVLTDPAVSITDKDARIRSAIQSVFPSTQRRLCSWHAAESVFTKARSFYQLEQFTHTQNLMKSRHIRPWSRIGGSFASQFVNSPRNAFSASNIPLQPRFDFSIVVSARNTKAQASETRKHKML
ncbi:hypothetical protein BLNAU_18087 [Blattamonas nauphoetae]|uniref:MULE transposase domain-containing protein n=1 Tax=Blattamonas nauphoetae TaxID=2049346 RepID=A0ABQ9X5E1_9EUKA|nr:hypothetical protein BLNAU_18087 [Blattamonas nauphoetae]